MPTRRPVVLFAALLAPAILGCGLLAGELSGYEAPAEPAEKPRVEVRGVAFEPVLAPAPPRPDLTYEGVLPAPVRETQRRTAQAVPVASGDEPVPSAQRTARPVKSGTECPGEWADTWLWELCREHERRAA